MSDLAAEFRALIVSRVNAVRCNLGMEALPEDDDLRFADALDSMGMVEFLGLIADDCGVAVETVERAAGKHYRTAAVLADDLASAGLKPIGVNHRVREKALGVSRSLPLTAPVMWLSAASAALPVRRQSAEELDVLLGRPPGWFSSHTGITARHVWSGQDSFRAAARSGIECLERAALKTSDLGALLVVSEAPPRPVGTAAALHHHLGLAPGVAALEIGNACTGFLVALWTAQRLLPEVGTALVIAIEAPTRSLAVRPGAAGEAAALFGDGAAACLLSSSPCGASAFPIHEVLLGTDGGAGDLLYVNRTETGIVEVMMDGPTLATKAVQTMARAVTEMAERHNLSIRDLGAIVAHGGNGRMPALLARQLGVAPESVWSATERTGNLGSASLPVAWATQSPLPNGPVIWVAVGAGLQWGAALQLDK